MPEVVTFNPKLQLKIGLPFRDTMVPCLHLYFPGIRRFPTISYVFSRKKHNHMKFF